MIDKINVLITKLFGSPIRASRITRTRQQVFDMATMAGGEYTSVRDFYRGRSIFITGGTGFMGKVLVEKLLRSCPDIKNIYLLMRPKKGQDVQQRLQELLNAPVTIFICFFSLN